MNKKYSEDLSSQVNKLKVELQVRAGREWLLFACWPSG